MSFPQTPINKLKLSRPSNYSHPSLCLNTTPNNKQTSRSETKRARERETKAGISSNTFDRAMNPLLACLLLLLPLSLASTSSPPPSSTCKTSSAGVDPTCKAVAHANPAIPYDYCARSLNSHPSAAAQDLAGLAASAARLAIAHAEATEARVEDLMDLEPDPQLKHRHYLCQEAFDDAGDALRDAFDSINTKQYAKAGRLLASSTGARAVCEKGFTARAQAPVSEYDDEYERLAALAQAILATVHYERASE